jgi:hypothetical protein
MDWRRGREREPLVGLDPASRRTLGCSPPADRTANITERRVLLSPDLGGADRRGAGRSLCELGCARAPERASPVLLGVDGAGAHLGLQWGADPPRRLRHVNWGGYGAAGAELSGEASSLPSSFSNANTRDYDWEPGRAHRLRICRAARGWAGWVDDTLVRCLDAPGATLRYPVVWSEVFADCDDPTISVRWSELEVRTRSGHRVPVGSVVARYQKRREEGCDNTSSSRNGDAFVQTTNAARVTPAGAVLRID